MSQSPFDNYAGSYESALQQGLSVSGESSDYFAMGRVKWLRKRLERLIGGSLDIESAMDFGCGTGNSVAFLLSELQVERVVGVDTSEQSLVQARERYSPVQTEFVHSENYIPSGGLDLAYCNGVFHHIPIEARASVASYIYRCLKPGGFFAFWENNPWNPGTRMVMSRIPFDRDAITLTILESKQLLRQAGFEVVRVDTCFYFPNLLRWLRPLEPCLAWLPLGAQYLVLAKKPIGRGG
jgi:SAM-dependent methyltransferase